MIWCEKLYISTPIIQKLMILSFVLSHLHKAELARWVQAPLLKSPGKQSASAVSEQKHICATNARGSSTWCLFAIKNNIEREHLRPFHPEMILYFWMLQQCQNINTKQQRRNSGNDKLLFSRIMFPTGHRTVQAISHLILSRREKWIKIKLRIDTDPEFRAPTTSTWHMRGKRRWRVTTPNPSSSFSSRYSLLPKAIQVLQFFSILLIPGFSD